jgi:crossover junction endodeoxyribonuclease RuvC
MIVLGIDPGLRVTGYSLVEQTDRGPVLREAGEIRSKPSHPLEQRLAELYRGLQEVIDEFRPDVMAVEELYAHREHPRTAVIMGHTRGVFFLLAGLSNIPVYSYAATRIKRSQTGTGHATKEQVAGMICRTLSSANISGHADVTDAIAAALCHLNAVSHGDLP